MRRRAGALLSIEIAIQKPVLHYGVKASLSSRRPRLRARYLTGRRSNLIAHGTLYWRLHRGPWPLAWRWKTQDRGS
jgi:hypothetical protein